MKEEMDSLINKTIYENSLVKINDKLYLKKYQMDVLDFYHIPYQNCSSISEVLFYIQEVLEDKYSDNQLLEEISLELQEFNYYHFTNK